MNRLFSFEKLEAYQISRDLAKEVYLLTREFPKYELYGLSDQVRRAAISVSSNLAEGTGKQTSKEKAHYTSISFSSLMEVLCQLQIATDLEYIDQEKYEQIRPTIKKLAVYLSKLRSAQLNF